MGNKSRFVRLQNCPCPLCDSVLTGEKILAKHFLKKHHGFTLWPHSLVVVGTSNHYVTIRCFCGIGFQGGAKNRALRAFVKHLREKGGLTAHILELTLCGHGGQ